MKKPKLFAHIPTWLIVILVVLVAARLIAPYAIRYEVNQVLANDIADYVGHVGDMDIALWRGNYSGQDFTLRKKGADHDLLKVKETSVSISWKALFHGHLMVNAAFIEPDVNFMSSDLGAEKTKKDIKTQAVPNDFKKTMHTVIPFQFQSIQILNGTFVFHDPSAKPPVAVRLDQTNATFANIGNLEILKDQLPAQMNLVTRIQGDAKFYVTGRADFLAESPRISVDLELKDLKVSSLNTFLKDYGWFDITKGTLSLTGHTNVTWPQLDLDYLLKLHALEVIAPKQAYRGVRGFLTEMGLAFANLILHDKQKNVQSELHITGAWPHPKLDTWKAVKTLVND